MKSLSWKSNWRHVSLETYIKEIDPEQDMSRSGITNRAIKTAVGITDWKPIQNNLASLANANISVPTAMQATPDVNYKEELKKNRI